MLVPAAGGLVGTAMCGVAGVFMLMMTLQTSSTQVEPPECSAQCDQISDVALDAYQQAAETAPCDGVEWTVLAGLGQIESRHGTLYGGEFNSAGVLEPPLLGPQLDGSGVGGNTTAMPSGRWVGVYGIGRWMQAVGPMQFLPSTWDIYGGGGNPQSIYDAARAAAALLCDAGAETDLKEAVHAYNRSWDYVAKVLHWAAIYGRWGGAETQQDAELLDNSRVCLSPQAAEDLRDGIVDPRLVVFLQQMAARWDYCISILRTGHAACVINTGIYPDCRVSNHWHGRGVDISAVGGELVRPNNEAAREVVRWIGEGQEHSWMPDSVGSPWGAEFGFTDQYHQDHLHIAFYTDGVNDPVGIGDKPADRPERVDNTSQLVSYQFPSVDWNDAAEPDEFVETWSEPLPAKVINAGGTVGEKWLPDIEYTSPEYEHPNEWRRPVRDKPGAGEDEEAHEVEPDEELTDLQALVDATPAGGTLVLDALQYTGAVIRRPITLNGPSEGNALIVEYEPTISALTVMNTSGVTITGLTVQGGRSAVFSQSADVRISEMVSYSADAYAISVRGGSAEIGNVTLLDAGGGIEFWSSDGSVASSLITEVGARGIDVVSGEVSIADTTVTAAGRRALSASLSATVTAERSFFGGSGTGAVAEGGSWMFLRRNAFWSNGPTAIDQQGTVTVVAAYANVVVDGDVNADFYAPGYVGESAAVTLGRPWIGADSRPTGRALAAIRSAPDTRASMGLEDWPRWP